VALKKVLTSREEPDISLSIVNSKARFCTHMHFTRVLFALGVAVRGDGGVAGEGRVVGVPKFHCLGKCTMPLLNINSDWMSNTCLPLACVLYWFIDIT